MCHEEEHVEPQKRHVLEDGDDDPHGVQADEALDADVMAQVLSHNHTVPQSQCTARHGEAPRRENK